MSIVNKTETFFTANTLASTNYLYSNTATNSTIQTATLGQVQVSGYNKKLFQIGVKSMNASTTKVWYSIEGRLTNMSSWGSVLTASVVSATALDDLVEVNKNIDYVRVGVKRVGTNTATLTSNSVTITAYLEETQE